MGLGTSYSLPEIGWQSGCAAEYWGLDREFGVTDLQVRHDEGDRNTARSAWCGLAAIGLMGLLATPVVAQEPYRSSYFPYVIGNPADGAMLVARWQRTQNAPYFISQSDDRDVINPVTFRGAFSIEAGIGTSGSRFGRVEFRGPAVVDGWRFRGYLAAERHARFGYYGFGGDYERTETAANPNSDEFRIRRVRYLAQGEVTRRIAGPLRFALGASFDHTDLLPLEPTNSRFRTDFGGAVERSNLLVRPALVLDTRDREFTPGNGVLLEVGGGLGTGGSRGTFGEAGETQSYGLFYTHLRGYVSPRDGTVLAGRVLFRALDDEAPLSARFTIPGWERELATAGAEGHRSFPLGALAGSRFTLASLELRHDLLNAGDFGAVTLLGFADWAQSRDGRALTFDRTSQFGGGGGVAVRVLRSAILTANFAGGANGFNFSMGTGWTF